MLADWCIKLDLKLISSLSDIPFNFYIFFQIMSIYLTITIEEYCGAQSLIHLKILIKYFIIAVPCTQSYLIVKHDKICFKLFIEVIDQSSKQPFLSFE